MPAHIEILSPQNISMANSGWDDTLNELTRRLHGYDEIARMMQIENSQMKKKMSELLPKKEADKEFAEKVEEDIKEEKKSKKSKKKKD